MTKNTFHNCFTKAGFGSHELLQEEEMEDSDTELQNLLEPFGKSAQDYVQIDAKLMTENTSDNIADLISHVTDENDGE